MLNKESFKELVGKLMGSSVAVPEIEIKDKPRNFQACVVRCGTLAFTILTTPHMDGSGEYYNIYSKYGRGGYLTFVQAAQWVADKIKNELNPLLITRKYVLIEPMMDNDDIEIDITCEVNDRIYEFGFRFCQPDVQQVDATAQYAVMEVYSDGWYCMYTYCQDLLKRLAQLDKEKHHEKNLRFITTPDDIVTILNNLGFEIAEHT